MTELTDPPKDPADNATDDRDLRRVVLGALVGTALECTTSSSTARPPR